MTAVSPARVVVVGTGHGLRVHVPALRGAGFEVVALVGTDPARTARRAAGVGIEDAFVDLAQAIRATGATAVVVASTPPSHGALVRVALQHECHVLCEKPFAASAAEARELLASAEQAGVIHVVGHQMRMLPERVLLGRAIADGAIGEPRLVTVTQHLGLLADTTARWPGWWLDRAAGGGWLGASGSHMIDMVRSWLGDYASLSASTLVVADRRDVPEDSYIVRFKLADGAEGVIAQTGGAWGPTASAVRVAGSQGSLWLEEGACWLADRAGVRTLPIPPELMLAPEPPSDDPRKRFLQVELPPARRLAETWHALIRGDVGAVAPATFADGLACMEVIDAIRRSTSDGGNRVDVTSKQRLETTVARIRSENMDGRPRSGVAD